MHIYLILIVVTEATGEVLANGTEDGDKSTAGLHPVFFFWKILFLQSI